MKRKGFCLKRAVSLLLAAVMIVTAAPQTSLTALAAEQGMTVDDPDVSENLEISTTEDGTSKETGDTASSESKDTAGQDGTGADGDIGGGSADVPSEDGVGVGSDEQTADFDNAEQPDNVGDNMKNPDGINQDDDAGDSDETADLIEGINNDMTTDGETGSENESEGGESVSGNDTEGGESVSGNDTEGGESVSGNDTGEGPNYKGEIREETIEDGENAGTSYRRLAINEWEAKEQNNGAEIGDILTYYAEQIEAEKCEKFNCVEFDMDAVSSSETLSFPMKKDDINGAISIMDTANEQIGCWIDYNFWNEAEHAGVAYALFQPREAKEDLDAVFTVTLMAHQGVKVHAKTTDFPAESVDVSYNKNQQDAFAECWDGAKQEDLRLLALDEGVLPSVTEPDGMWFGEFTFEDEGETGKGSNFGISMEGIQAEHDYLITPLYVDEGSVAMGATKELTAGERSGSSDGVSDVNWKSLDENLISIESGEGTAATLTAKDEMGEAYYYVTYKCNDQEWLELHSVQVSDAAPGGELAYVGEVVQDKFEDGDLAGTPYLRLVIDEWEAKEKNNGKEIADILTYYAEQIEAGKCEKFNCVGFDMDALSSSETPSFPMKKDNINGAISVMDTANEQIGYWIDYNFWNDKDSSGVTYSLSQPHEAKEDPDAAFTVTPMPHQGVKVNAKTTEFPAEFVTVSYDKQERDAFAECWDGARQDDLRLLALEDGVSQSVIEPDEMWFDEYDFENEGQTVYGSSFGISMKGMQAGHDYLITPLYADECFVPKGTSNEIKAGKRSGSVDGVSDAVWKSLNESLISIVPGTGADATLTAKDEKGEAYYYVKYKCNDQEWLELHLVQLTYGASDGELAYIGKIVRDKFEDGDLAGTPYLRLIIDEAEAAEKNSSKDITPILKFYKEKERKFNCVEFNIIDESPNTRVVKKDYINNALSIMDTENDTAGYWIDYNFRNDRTDTGVNFALSSPYEAGADVNAAFTLTDLKDKGLKVQFASTDFPAERVSMSYDLPGRQFADSLPINDESFRLFTHSSGTPMIMVAVDEEQGWGYYATGGEGDDVWTNVYFNNIKPLGTTEYLAASIYKDEERPVVGRDPVQLKAGTRAGVSTSSAASVIWKLFDTDKAILDKDGKLTAWSSQSEIYYYVQYKVGSTQYLEVHEMWAKGQPVRIYFDKEDITVEMNDNPDDPSRKYLRLRFKPSDADRDTHDPDQIKWEITESDGGDKPVIDFVYYDNDWNEIERDENGRLPEGAAPNGEIKALNEGTATVKVSYLDVAEGEQIPTATCTVKVVKPITWEDMEQEVNAMNLYAITDLDTKLSDITLGKGWKWEDPDTLLANFKGMDGGQFPAVYTAENGKTFYTSLWVRFVIVTGVEIESKNENKQEGSDEPDWFDWVPDSIEKGDKITLRYSYRIDNLDGENEETWQKEYAAVKTRMEEKYRIEWTSSPAAGTAANDGTYQFTAPSITKAQKNTFTVSVKDKATNKVFLKNSCAITVTVNPIFNWDLVEGPWTDMDDKRLNYKVRMAKNDYESQPLTIVSEDTAILKLTGKAEITQEQEEITGESGDKETVTYTYVRIPCENLKPGTAWIKMTASDEIKSFRRDCHEFIDKEPKLTVSAITINQALEDKSAMVTVRTHMQYPIDISQVTLLLNEQNTTDITAGVTSTTLVGSEEDKNNSYYDYNIKLDLKENAGSVKKGKNTVTLKLVVKPADDAGVNAGQETYSLNLTVNIINTVPKVTCKQAKKVNLFYTDEEGYGILNVDVTGTDIKDLELKGCDFEVKRDAEFGVYRIAPKANVNGSSKKGTLSYKLEGCLGTFETAFTVSTEDKKPTIVLSQKSDTLYPVAGYKTSWLRMSDKETGDNIIPSAVTYVDKKNGINHPLPIDRDDVDWENHTGEWNITNKTDYNLVATTWGGIAFLLQDQAQYKKKTDKFSLEIKKTNWKEPIAVSYSIKVDTAKPKLVLGKSTLTLNKNEAVYHAQQERTSLHLKGTADPVYQDEWHWVTFEGQDEKSRKILRTDNSLVLQYRSDQGDVIVNFNDHDMAVGIYKFKVNVGNSRDGLIASTVLKVKIVDIPIAKTLKVTGKGSIDVMNREGTSIVYTPKISNISGKVVEGRLEGMDSELFENWWDDDKLIVKARGDITYSTRHTYRVRAVFEVETWEYERLTVSTDTAKPLSIKVKQSKPKLTASTAGNTIYRQFDNAVEIKLSAVLNNREVEIDDAWLINYTDDFELKTTPAWWIDEEGNVHPYYAIYNPQTKSVRLGLIDRYGAKNIIKSGKTWKVKLAVRYREQAGNEKVAQVTCAVVVH